MRIRFFFLGKSWGQFIFWPQRGFLFTARESVGAYCSNKNITTEYLLHTFKSLRKKNFFFFFLFFVPHPSLPSPLPFVRYPLPTLLRLAFILHVSFCISRFITEFFFFFFGIFSPCVSDQKKPHPFFFLSSMSPPLQPTHRLVKIW